MDTKALTLTELLTARQYLQTKVAEYMVAKGEGEGHEFRGNRYTGGIAGEGKEPVYTEAEQAAFKEYTGYGYGNINGLLRGTWTNPDAGLAAEAEKHTKALDSAMAKSVVNQDVTVYRSIGTEVFDRTSGYSDDPKFNWKSVEGTSFIDRGFTSTTENPKGDFDFKSGLMEIHVPAGTHGIYLKGWEANPKLGERELLLDRGRTYTIRSVDTSTPGKAKLIVDVTG